MDENKIIRVILQAVDDISGPLKRARKNIKSELFGIDNDFKKSGKGVKDYDETMQHLIDTYGDAKKPISENSDLLHTWAQALKDTDAQTKKTTHSLRQFFNTKMPAKDAYLDTFEKRAQANRKFLKETKNVQASVIGIVQDIKGEVRGRRTIRGDDGRILPGKGMNVGSRVQVDTETKKVVVINRQLNDALAIGFRLSRDTQKTLDGILGATKKIRKENLAAAEEKFKKDQIDLSIEQDKRRAKEADIVELRTRESGFLEKKLALQKEQNAAAIKFEESRDEADLAKLSKAENEVKFIQNHIDQIKRDVITERTRAFQTERKNLRQLYELEKANIKNLSKEDALRVIKRIQLERKIILNQGTSRDRVVKRIGFATGDFFGGIGRGRSQVRDLDKDLEKLSSRFGRLGFAIGSAFKDLNSFVNLRWLFITSAVTLLINLLTQLVVVLVSVASSAILAASALGAALVGGIAQAIPVVGLFVGAFHELTKAMAAVKLANKRDLTGADAQKEVADKKTQALQRLADAHYSVKKAIESVSDSQYSLNQSNKDVTKAYDEQKTAIKSLAEARKQAAQDIIDANLQEKDSALALKEAELAVLQAKEKLRQEEEKKRRGGADIAGAQAAVKEAQDRLAKAKSQGDNPEIILANQQLSVVQQNLNDIQDAAAQSTNDLKDAQLGVQRAEINRQQAVQKKKKDTQQAQILTKKGVNQSDLVLAAEKQLATATQGIADAQHNVIQSQRALADQIHSLAVSRREENDAKKALLDTTNLQSTAQKNLNNAIADFSPAEKKLFKSLIRVRDAYRKAFVGSKGKNGILSPIIEGFASIADALTKLLKDPEILKALGKLAKGIGAGIKDLASGLSSKGFKDDVLFFISEAADNLPKVFNIFKNILEIVRDIARAGSPIFDDLLGGLDKLIGRASKFTSKKGDKETVNRPGGKVDITKSPLQKFLGNAEKHLDAWLKLGKAIIAVIAALTNVSAPTGKSLIESLTENINKLTKYINKHPKEVKKFFNDIASAFKELADALLKLAIIFGRVAQDKQIQDFALFLIDTIVPGLFLMIKTVGYLVGALNTLTKIPLLGPFLKFAIEVAVAEKALNKLFPFSQGITKILRKSFKELFLAVANPKRALNDLKGIIDITGEAATNTGKKLIGMGKNWKDVGKSAQIAGSHFNDLRKAKGIVGALTTMFPLLGAAIDLALGPVGLIILAVIAIGAAIFLLDKKFHFIRPTIDFFWKSLKSIFDWIKSHWRLVLVLLTGPIAAAVLLIIKHWDKIKAIFFGFAGLLTKYFFKPVYDNLVKPFVLASEFIIKLFKKLPGILGGILKKIPGLGFLIKHVGGPIGKVVKGIFGGAKDVATGAVKNVGNATNVADTALGGTHPKGISPTRVINNDRKDIKLIKKLRAQGKSDPEILTWLIEHGSISKTNFRKRFGFPLTSVQGFAGGSSGVKGRDTIPAMLAPGEWVLNSKQQRKLASVLGTSITQAKAMVFGTNTGPTMPHGLKPSRTHKTYAGGTFNLIPQETDSTDNQGRPITAWFIQMADGTFGQVTGRDATKIQNTKGKYIPNYVRRNAHGFSQRLQKAIEFRNTSGLGMNMGGIVMPGVQRFESGGIVQSPGFGNSNSKSGATVNQEFNVKTEGATDWAYVMRLSSITAQSAF